MLGWLVKLIARVDHSFNRRLRRASGLDLPQPLQAPADAEPAADQDGTEISNVALGTGVEIATAPRPALTDLSADLPPPPIIRPLSSQPDDLPQEDDEEGTIVNI